MDNKNILQLFDHKVKYMENQNQTKQFTSWMNQHPKLSIYKNSPELAFITEKQTNFTQACDKETIRQNTNSIKGKRNKPCEVSIDCNQKCLTSSKQNRATGQKTKRSLEYFPEPVCTLRAGFESDLRRFESGIESLKEKQRWQSDEQSRQNQQIKEDAYNLIIRVSTKNTQGIQSVRIETSFQTRGQTRIETEDYMELIAPKKEFDQQVQTQAYRFNKSYPKHMVRVIIKRFELEPVVQEQSVVKSKHKQHFTKQLFFDVYECRLSEAVCKDIYQKEEYQLFLPVKNSFKSFDFKRFADLNDLCYFRKQKQRRMDDDGSMRSDRQNSRGAFSNEFALQHNQIKRNQSQIEIISFDRQNDQSYLLTFNKPKIYTKENECSCCLNNVQEDDYGSGYQQQVSIGNCEFPEAFELAQYNLTNNNYNLWPKKYKQCVLNFQLCLDKISFKLKQHIVNLIFKFVGGIEDFLIGKKFTIPLYRLQSLFSNLQDQDVIDQKSREQKRNKKQYDEEYNQILQNDNTYLVSKINNHFYEKNIDQQIKITNHQIESKDFMFILLYNKDQFQYKDELRKQIEEEIKTISQKYEENNKINIDNIQFDMKNTESVKITDYNYRKNNKKKRNNQVKGNNETSEIQDLIEKQYSMNCENASLLEIFDNINHLFENKQICNECDLGYSQRYQDKFAYSQLNPKGFKFWISKRISQMPTQQEDSGSENQRKLCSYGWE